MAEGPILLVVVAVAVVQLAMIVRTTPRLSDRGQAGRRERTGVRAWAPQVGWVLVGPVVAGLDLAVVGSLPWADLRLAALVAAGLPVTAALLVAQDLLLARHLAPLLQREHQSGRQTVLDVAHGALSTNLRLLEHRADQHRATQPEVAGLATNLNSRLREILALADAGLATSEDPSSLTGPVQTLVRAYGADAEVSIRVRSLTEAEHELALFAVTELVRSALEAGAAAIAVSLVRRSSGAGVQVVAAELEPSSDLTTQERQNAFAERGIELRESVRRGQTVRLATLPPGR